MLGGISDLSNIHSFFVIYQLYQKHNQKETPYDKT
jgi:hypothetical protein